MINVSLFVYSIVPVNCEKRFFAKFKFLMLFSIMNNICFSDEKCLFELIMLFLFFQLFAMGNDQKLFFEISGEQVS